MRNRRFLLLGAVLVALNTALWLVPQGLALQQVVVSKLFGSRMVRAEVVEVGGADWRVDRGIVTSNVPPTSTAPGQLTLQEADTTVQQIATSASTRVTAGGYPFKLRNVKPGWRVLVVWPGSSGAAVSVVVERR
jgi:hypothetical protein